MSGQKPTFICYFIIIYTFLFTINIKKKWESVPKSLKPLQLLGFSLDTFILKVGKWPKKVSQILYFSIKIAKKETMPVLKVGKCPFLKTEMAIIFYWISLYFSITLFNFKTNIDNPFIINNKINIQILHKSILNFFIITSLEFK